MEVHPASTSDVKTVINKLEWLQTWLRNKAPALNAEPKSYHWVPSGRNTILKDSKQARQCAKKGINIEKKVFIID